MMANITIKYGDLLEHVTSGHILHGCNAQGVMGGGFALLVKNQYPSAYNDYLTRYQSRGLMLGTAYPVISEDVTIWNMITQEYFGSLHSHLDMNLIKTSFNDFLLKLKDGRDIHMPLIGCGLAIGKIDVVIPTQCDLLSVLENDITIWVMEEHLVSSLHTLIATRGNDHGYI